MGRVTRDYTKKEAIETLKETLKRYHREYDGKRYPITMDDVELSVRGYLHITKPFKWKYESEEKYFTIGLAGVSKDRRCPYQLWDALKKYHILPEEKINSEEVEK